MKSFIRWAGSKRKLLQPLEERWLQSNAVRYIEPFCGSACLFFHVEPEYSVLGDTNEWLISTYEALRDSPDEVADKLYSLNRSKELYNKIRSIHFSRFEKINSAAYFLYLNRLCFNGLFRTNKKNLFNVPYSNNKTGSFPTRKQILKASSILRRSDLVSTDFSKTILNNIQSNDFVYIDPPYATENTRIFRQYNSVTFGVEDIDRLDSVLEIIDKKGAFFVLSYADTKEMSTFKKKWDATIFKVNRNIAGFADKRKQATELILKNF